jgi:adenosylcobinamide kinase/adenosylcobinamide-phosphate guanylyltransferase
MTARRQHSHLVFVLGGASSGKSDVALQLAGKGIDPRAPRAFVATAEGMDEEMALKIARHRQSRSSAWATAEVPVNLTGWLNEEGRRYRVIVIDCLTMWLSNHCGLGKKEADILEDVRALLHVIRRSAARFVLVSNELGMGLVPADARSRRFRELAGDVNQLVAQEADDAYFVVSGMCLSLK